MKQRQQASLLAAVVNCDRKYVPNNVYGSYLRVMVEPRGVEPLSESTFTVTSPGAVCLLGFPPQRAGKQARRFGRVMLHDGGNSYPVHVHH